MKRLKTLLKKSVKFHFDDVFQEMEAEDEKNFDLALANEPILENIKVKEA